MKDKNDTGGFDIPESDDWGSSDYEARFVSDPDDERVRIKN